MGWVGPVGGDSAGRHERALVPGIPLDGVALDFLVGLAEFGIGLNGIPDELNVNPWDNYGTFAVGNDEVSRFDDDAPTSNRNVDLTGYLLGGTVRSAGAAEDRKADFLALQSVTHSSIEDYPSGPPLARQAQGVKAPPTDI
jgi:hypothetical protein